MFSSDHCRGLDWSFWTNLFTPFGWPKCSRQLSYLAALSIYGVFGHYRNNCRWFWQLFDFLSRPTGSSYRFFFVFNDNQSAFWCSIWQSNQFPNVQWQFSINADSPVRFIGQYSVSVAYLWDPSARMVI